MAAGINQTVQTGKNWCPENSLELGTDLGSLSSPLYHQNRVVSKENSHR